MELSKNSHWQVGDPQILTLRGSAEIRTCSAAFAIGHNPSSREPGSANATDRIPSDVQATRSAALAAASAAFRVSMSDWPKRERAEAGFFAGLLRHAGAVRVLDAAAGTGFHSVTLTAAGFDVTAVDGSAEMLRRAVANGEERGIALRAICADWRDIVEKVGTASTPSSAWEVLFLTCSAIRTAAARWRPSAPP